METFTHGAPWNQPSRVGLAARAVTPSPEARSATISAAETTPVTPPTDWPAYRAIASIAPFDPSVGGIELNRGTVTRAPPRTTSPVDSPENASAARRALRSTRWVDSAGSPAEKERVSTASRAPA